MGSARRPREVAEGTGGHTHVLGRPLFDQLPHYLPACWTAQPMLACNLNTWVRAPNRYSICLTADRTMLPAERRVRRSCAIRTLRWMAQSVARHRGDDD